MTHLTNYEMDGPCNPFIANNPFDLKGPSKLSVNNDVYVGQIPSNIDHHHLKSFFSQFGEIERVFEGRRGLSRGMKWAFISYINPEDAYKYISCFRPTECLQVSCNKPEELVSQVQCCFYSGKNCYLIFLVLSVLATRTLLSNVNVRYYHPGMSVEVVTIHLRQ